MTITIPRDLTLTVRRGSDVTDGKAADVRVSGDTATVVYDRHRTDPGVAVWLARILLHQYGYAVRETVLDGMGPDITALFREASRLRLNVELGSRVTEPTVLVADDGPASYLIPAGWDLADAADRLPAAHEAARPDVVRSLRAIAKEKRDHDGLLDKALDTAAGMILETGDPDGVWDTLTRVLDQVAREQAKHLDRADPADVAFSAALDAIEAALKASTNLPRTRKALLNAVDLYADEVRG